MEKRAPKSLFLLSATGAGVIVFIVMAALALGGEPMDFDRGALTALRHAEDPEVPIGPPWLLPAARDLTTLAGTPVLTVMTLVLAGYFALKRQWSLLVLLLAAVVGETLLAQNLKALFARPRPDIVPHLVEASSASFPSGHSTSAAAIYLTLAALIARETKERLVRNYVFAVAVAMALIVGASRVFLGVHYPTDVIGGLSFGAAWAAIVLIAARKLEEKA